MITLVVCVRRKPGMTVQDFLAYYRDKHAPLIADCPQFTQHLVSYTQYHVADPDSPIATLFGTSGNYDAVAALTFKSEAAMTQAFVEPDYLDRIRPDEPNFVDLKNCMSFVTTPFPVLQEVA